MVKTRFVPLACLVALVFQGTSLAGEKSAGTQSLPDYIRHAEDAHHTRLEIAIRSFRMPSGQQVDLIGVVHIADDAYYQVLNRRFDRYDSVLFELVGNPRHVTETAPQLLKQQSGQQSTSMVSSLQQVMGRYLNLTFQLGAIDYTKKNMVHADTSAAEFARMQQERGENMLTLFFRAMNAQLSRGPNDAAATELNLFALIRILMSPDAATEFKRVLAREFDRMESLTALMEGDQGSAILGGRNAVVMKKIEEVLANRKQRRIAVFFGAAHMPGIEALLTAKLDARAAGQEWLAAWTIPK